MKAAYAEALIAVLDSGMPIEQALTGLLRAMKVKQHEKLYAPVLQEALRALEAKKGAKHAVVMVAHEGDKERLKADITSALALLGVPSKAEIVTSVNETLIGGFLVSYDGKERDGSYKKALKSLYESVIK